MMNTVDSCMLLSGSGYMSSILFGIGGTLNVKWGHNKEAVVSSILMVLCSGMSVAGITIEGHIVDNRTQEIINYISSLSTEELETLSEDLVSADISDSYIEVELSDRIDTLSENSDLFNSDEERDLLQESVADYLTKLSQTNYEEYERVLELLSDGGYEESEIFNEIGKEKIKDDVVKSLNL